MKLRTKIDVTYNSGVAGTNTGIVEGVLLSAGWIGQGFEQIGANYAYADSNGNTLAQGGFTVEGANIQALYDAIEGSIPTGLSYQETEQYKYYLAFLYEMSQTFSIELTDIEIVA
jgi:hypothetical protein